MKKLVCILSLIFCCFLQPAHAVISSEMLMDEQLELEENYEDYSFVDAQDFLPIEKSLRMSKQSVKKIRTNNIPFLVSPILYFYQSILSNYIICPFQVILCPSKTSYKIYSFLVLLYLF